jgi:arsenical pump membrane protein
VPGAAAETVAVLLLVLSVAAAVLRPRDLSEALVAVPAATVLVGLGVVPASAAGQTLRQFAPTVGFLAAILVFGQLCADAGVFGYLGSLAASAARGRVSTLLGVIVVIAASVTVVLTLDATVVLLTPVVLAASAGANAQRPLTLSCVRLANSASLLLPVSNLTNLLAFSVTRLSFGRFAALMLLPWLVVVLGEWLTVRTAFPVQLRSGSVPAACPLRPPRYALGVVAGTVAGFVVLSSVHVAIAWAALAGCLALLLPRLPRHSVDPRRLVGAASLGFCAFVLALAVIVDGVARHGLADVLEVLLPHGSSLADLLAVAVVAAVLALLVNNLPATLLLVPIVAASPAAVLAVLVGVNIGPNATYSGSLATLLWRRIVPAGARPSTRAFHLLGACSVAPLIALAVSALWVAVSALGV